jgi:hypothetical protein
MKKISAYIIAALAVVLSLSCEENLNPYGELLNKYVLNCVVRGDTTFQSATLTGGYQAANFDPYTNISDKTIHGYIVRIWSGNDKVAILRDTTIVRPEGESYQSPYSVYYSKDFQPNPSDTITIEAILPNGQRLKSSTVAPAQLSMSGLSDAQIPPTNKNYLTYIWTTDQKDPIFITRLGIYYYKNANGVKTSNLAVVPESYVQYDNQWIPNYPKPTSDKGLVVDMATVTKTMQLLSGDDPVKSNYVILGCILEVLSLDKNLSTYYNATARGRDIYSVKLDETDYSNITGGYGVFGVYMRTYKVAFFNHSYIESFGYKAGLEEGKGL